ncbi:hypothetical protein O181_005700 [Austropuccinia psidii MF-1]|uniref:Glutathione hydrolase n=1 Tax=Austropuccinia psidii MF-1 TaxID=1389203 RepID=A0A9Q3GG37_9BASI|nr:hypothetical protein [Austropuccinia psidii MF-1]
MHAPERGSCSARSGGTPRGWGLMIMRTLTADPASASSSVSASRGAFGIGIGVGDSATYMMKSARSKSGDNPQCDYHLPPGLASDAFEAHDNPTNPYEEEQQPLMTALPVLLTPSLAHHPVPTRRQALTFPSNKKFGLSPHIRFWFLCLWTILIILSCYCFIIWNGSSTSVKFNSSQPHPSYLVSGRNGVVATEEERCSKIGIDVLKDNGTATDAAIAAALCIGVVNSFSSGVGGGGFMVIKPAPCRTTPNCTDQHPISIDFRETVPDGKHYSQWFSKKPSLSQVGGLASGIPGELAGFESAYRSHGGGVTWKRLFEPSIHLAKNFTVGPALDRTLASNPWIKSNPQWRDIFYPASQPSHPRTGFWIQRSAYAKTLETIANDGVKAFYHGRIARKLVSTMNREGGKVQLKDFENYRAIVQPALNSTYHGRTVWTSGIPSSGPILIYLLNILEQYSLNSQPQTALAEHRFIEALKYAFAGRTEVADPQFLNQTQLERMKMIHSKSYGRKIYEKIDDNTTYEYQHYQPKYDFHEDHGTSHLSVVDKHGSAVALTTTVNLDFGSHVMDSYTGIILNSENDDFSIKGRSNHFDLFSSPLNYPETGKRPASSMAPVIIDEKDQKEVWCVLGASGGSRIFSAIAGVLLKIDWGYDVSHAIEEPRSHHQLLPDQLYLERPYRLDFLNLLQSRGHNITLIDRVPGKAVVQGIVRNSLNGLWYGASDSRKNGIAKAY